MIELLVVVVVLALLIAIAVPAYLTIKAQAAQTDARAQVRTAVPSLNEYMVDHNNTYSGVTIATLRTTYDASLLPARVYVEATGGGDSFYVCAHVQGYFAEQLGPRASISKASVAKADLPSGGSDCAL